MQWVLIVVVTVAIAAAAAAGAGFSKHQHLPPHHPHRFYQDHPPKIIASPKPRSYVQSPPPPPPNYRTVNPVYVPYRSPRSNHPPPQMIASPSNTPVLVLKKDHARPVLSSAVHAQKRSEPQQVPTIQMERPHQQPPQQQHHQITEPLRASGSSPQPNVTTTHRPSSPLPPQPELLEDHESISEEEQQQQQQRDHQLRRHHHHHHQQPGDETGPTSPTASAERRMFFESVANNQGLAQQVSGPRPTGPNNDGPAIIKHAASSNNLHSAQPPRGGNRRDDDDDDDDEDDRERITRSNNPYQGGNPGLGGFQYPPPQGNFLAGPTRVPVKYQQGVIGLKPQQQFIGGHPGLQQHPGRKPSNNNRPYKQRIQQSQQPGSAEEPLSEELEEEAQPDRLTELLQTSKFQCGGKKDGYYADDTLNCEVFHYCQDGGKHSWLCPNGFAFHQIHLICVPPSSDNICKQSSNYHFVNEYLYKPINEKEAQTYNESLKYADRYFPDGYNHGAGDVLLPYHQQQSEQDDEDEPQQQHHHQQRPHPHQQQQPRPHHHHQYPSAQQPPRAGPYNPYAAAQPPRPSHLGGGFIPSQQINPRIPIISSPRPNNPYAQQQQHSSQSQIHPQIAPHHHQSHGPKSNHHHHHQSSKSKSNPNVFFTPESINIPLNQRRPIPNPHAPHHPQIFKPSPQVLHHTKKVSSSSPPQQSAAAAAGSSNKRKFVDYDEEY